MVYVRVAGRRRREYSYIRAMRWQSLGFYCKACIIGVIKDPGCACQIQCQDNLLRGGQLGGSVSRHREGHHCRPPFWDPSSPTLLCDAGVSAAAHGRAHHRQHRPPVPRRPLKMATDNIKRPGSFTERTGPLPRFTVIPASTVLNSVAFFHLLFVSFHKRGPYICATIQITTHA